MMPITTSREACSISFNWQKPLEGGSTIESYKIEVQGADKKFHKIDICSDSEGLSCVVKLDQFFKAPYNLK